MEKTDLTLPRRVARISVAGKNIYLVGTAHVAKESVEDVRATIEAVAPDTVCVELCAARHKAIVQRDEWKKMNIFKVIKEKKSAFLLAQLIMNSFYRRIGEQLGVDVPYMRTVVEVVTKLQNGELQLEDSWDNLKYFDTPQFS